MVAMASVARPNADVHLQLPPNAKSEELLAPPLGPEQQWWTIEACRMDERDSAAPTDIARRKNEKAAATLGKGPPAAKLAEDTISQRLKFKHRVTKVEPDAAAGVQHYMEHMEQGLGEVMRRLERKVDTVTSLLDQNVLELLEVRLASGVVDLERRLEVLEEVQQRTVAPAPVSDASRLLVRVAAMEAAMAEQGRAVAELLDALRTHGTVAMPQQASRPLAEVQEVAMHQAANPAAHEAGPESAKAVPSAALCATTAKQTQQELSHPVPPQQQLLQRKPSVVRRSLLADSSRAAAGSPKPVRTRLATTHAAGTAQRIAMDTAREQLAKQAARAHEEETAETPVWVSMVYVFGWTLLVAVGLAALAMGALAMLVTKGRLSESDLELLWRR